MMLDKKIVIGMGVTVFLMVSLTIGINITDGSSSLIDTPNWEKGYYWKYYAESDSYLYDISMEVISTDEIVNYGYSSYSCYKVKCEMKRPETSQLVMIYIEKNTLATVKMGEEVYSPPDDQYNFPINVGEKWQVDVTRHYSNGDTYNETISYECRREVKVTVPAGTFNTYEIKRVDEWADSDKEYELIYYSPKCKNMVKRVEYGENWETEEKELDSIVELTEYSLKGEEENGIPAFEFAFLIIAIAMILIMRRNKRNQ